MNKQDFITYVMSFYNDKDGIYPIKNLTRKEVIKATNIYFSKLDSLNCYTWGGGDSVDRERVRDIININRGDQPISITLSSTMKHEPNKLEEAIKEASISIACCLDEVTDITEYDLQHIQTQIDIIEDELKEMNND